MIRDEILLILLKKERANNWPMDSFCDLADLRAQRIGYGSLECEHCYLACYSHEQPWLCCNEIAEELLNKLEEQYWWL